MIVGQEMRPLYTFRIRKSAKPKSLNLRDAYTDPGALSPNRESTGFKVNRARKWPNNFQFRILTSTVVSKYRYIAVLNGSKLSDFSLGNATRHWQHAPTSIYNYVGANTEIGTLLFIDMCGVTLLDIETSRRFPTFYYLWINSNSDTDEKS